MLSIELQLISIYLLRKCIGAAFLCLFWSENKTWTAKISAYSLHVQYCTTYDVKLVLLNISASQIMQSLFKKR